MAMVRAHTLTACGLLLAGSFIAGSVCADTLDMGGTESADPSVYAQTDRPTRGMTQARVEAKYGAPQSRKPAVGDPPISRWDYPKFVVYFEYDRVIHAVIKR
jgi:hypothetical protein